MKDHMQIKWLTCQLITATKFSQTEAAVFHHFITSEFFNTEYICLYIMKEHGNSFHFVYSLSLSALTEGLAVGFKIHYWYMQCY